MQEPRPKGKRLLCPQRPLPRRFVLRLKQIKPWLLRGQIPSLRQRARQLLPLEIRLAREEVQLEEVEVTRQILV
jgi:hypothetical protein